MKLGRALAIFLIVAAVGVGLWFVLDASGNDASSDYDVATTDRAEEEGGGALGSARDLGRPDAPRAGAKRVDRTPERVVESDRVGTGVLRVRFLQKGKPLRGGSVRLIEGLAGSHATAPQDGAIAIGQDGRVKIEGLPAGSGRIELDHPLAPRAWHTTAVVLRAGESKDLGDIVVPEAAGLRGRVVDPGGTPVADATVFVQADVLAGAFGGKTEAGNSTKTDRAGRFELTRLAAAPWVLGCDHPTFRRAEQRAQLRAGDYRDLGDIQLARGLSLQGIVVDESGHGIGGAKVSYQHRANLGTARAAYYATKRAVKTSADGRFRLAGLPDKIKLMVEAKDFVTLMDKVVVDPSFAQRIILHHKLGVGGLVTNAAKLDGRAVVWMLRQADEGSERLQTRADDEGKFFFENVPTGRYRIFAEVDGFGASRMQTIRVGAEGVAGIALLVERGPQVVVHVVNAENAPVANARVRLRVQSGEFVVGGQVVKQPTRVAQTDDAGVARLNGAWVGKGVLDITHPGYLSAVREDVALQKNGVTVEIKLEAGGYVVGKCIDTTGALLPGIHVQVRPKPKPQPAGTRVVRRSIGTEHANHNVVTRKDGTFRAGPLRAGEYRVGASWKRPGAMTVGGGASVVVMGADADAEAERSVQVAAGQESTVVLQLARPGSLQGRVLYQGRPVAGARVFAKRVTAGEAPAMSGFGAEQAVTNGDGRYRFAALRTGNWKLSAKPPKGPIPTSPIDLVMRDAGDETRDIELGGGQIRGLVVRGDRGRSGPALEVELQKVGGKQTRSTARVVVQMTRSSNGSANSASMTLRPPDAPEPVRVHKDGTFLISFVPAGKWSVRITEGGDLTRWTKEIEVRDGVAEDLGRIKIQKTFPVDLRIVTDKGTPDRLGSLRILELVRDKKGAEVPGQSVFSGMVKGGKCHIPGLAAGRYRIEYRRIVMGAGAAAPAKPQTGDLIVASNGTVTGSRLQLAK